MDNLLDPNTHILPYYAYCLWYIICAIGKHTGLFFYENL